MVVMPALIGSPWYRPRLRNLMVSSLPSILTTLFVTVLTTLIPSKVGYSTILPLSSHAGVPIPTVPILPSLTPSNACLSNSLSTASLRPNSIESSLASPAAACCISEMAATDSSYCRCRFPLEKLNVVRARPGTERTAKASPWGLSVRAMGTVLVCSGARGVSRGSRGSSRGRCAPF